MGQFEPDHKLGGRLHRHICVYCLKKGKVVGHAEKDCALSRKNGSKKCYQLSTNSRDSFDGSVFAPKYTKPKILAEACGDFDLPQAFSSQTPVQKKLQSSMNHNHVAYKPRYIYNTKCKVCETETSSQSLP